MGWGTQAKMKSLDRIVATKFVLQCVIKKFPKSFFLIGIAMYYYPTNTNASQRGLILAGSPPRWFKTSTETVDY
jgi:hypothetical protein